MAVFLAAGGSVKSQIETIEIAPDRLERSISEDGQFAVFGETLELRTSFLSFAESVKKKYVRLLQRGSAWDSRIVFRVEEDPLPGSSRIALQANEIGGGYRLDIHVRMGPDFRADELRDQTLRMLMFEQCLRNCRKTPEGDPIPRWLREGLPEAIRFRERGEPTSLYASIFKTGQVLAAREILNKTDEKDDSISDAIFRASACGFVYMLLDQANGPKRLSNLIDGLANNKQSMGDMVARHFPRLRGTERRLEQRWALQASQLAERKFLERLSALDSEKVLGEALTFHFVETEPVSVRSSASARADDVNSESETLVSRKKKNAFQVNVLFWKRWLGSDGKQEKTTTAKPKKRSPKEKKKRIQCGVHEFKRILHRRDKPEILGRSRMALMELSIRAFPLYEDVIRDYQDVLARLEKGATRGVAAELVRLDEERAALLDWVSKVNDHLNWYEVTQTDTKSGAFKEYQRKARQVEAGRESRRLDVISKYLDSLESEFR